MAGGRGAGLGAGLSLRAGGEAETSAKANDSIAAKLPIAGLIILLRLVAQFNSMRRPIIILLTIPLGMIGVTVGLLFATVLTLGGFALGSSPGPRKRSGSRGGRRGSGSRRPGSRRA